MKTNFSLFLALVIIASFSFIEAKAQPKPPSGKKWMQVNELSDDFTSWNSDKWTKPTWNYGEPVQMVTGNSGVSNGNLWIKATLGSGDRWFETSRVMSSAQIKFPMYTECRMKTSHLSAFSTYWLNNGDIDDRDEIDICEHNSKPSWPGEDDRPYEMYSQYFIVEDGDTEREHMPRVDTRNDISSSNPAKNKKWNEEYQILGCYWKDKNNIEFYINGEKVGSLKSTRDFSRSLNIIWDLWTADEQWTGGVAAKSDLSNNNINTMYVDWVRTYELKDVTNPQFFIVNNKTQMKIRSANSTYGSQIELVPASWTGNPTKWEKVFTDNGYFKLRNISSGMYFTPSNDNDGSKLIQAGATNAQWKLSDATGDYSFIKYRAKNKHVRPKTAVKYSEINLQPSTWTGTWTQWKFVNTSTGALVKAAQMDQLSASSDNKLLVYPNPASDEINILIDNEEKEARYSLLDIHGREMISSNFYGVSVNVETSSLPKGIYVVKVETETTTMIKTIAIE